MPPENKIREVFTNRTSFVASVAVAFIAGCGATQYVLPAMAAENITAQVIHIPELNGDALGPASATGFRSKMFVSADGMIAIKTPPQGPTDTVMLPFNAPPPC